MWLFWPWSLRSVWETAMKHYWIWLVFVLDDDLHGSALDFANWHHIFFGCCFEIEPMTFRKMVPIWSGSIAERCSAMIKVGSPLDNVWKSWFGNGQAGESTYLGISNCYVDLSAFSLKFILIFISILNLKLFLRLLKLGLLVLKVRLEFLNLKLESLDQGIWVWLWGPSFEESPKSDHVF